MKMLGSLCKCTAIAVCIIAIVAGMIVSGLLAEHTPLFEWLDTTDIFGRKILLGLTPHFHKNKPWGYTFDELQQLDLSQTTVLVTGGNSGLGYWSAYHLASNGAQVEKISQQAGRTGSVTGMQCDLASFQSVLDFSKRLEDKYDALDSIILNAGLGGIPFSKTTDGIELQIGTNHFGHFLLTRELLPLLQKAAKKKGSATVVSVSSAAHYFSYTEGILPSLQAMNDEKRYNKLVAYAQSKLANILFTQELAERHAADGILANSVHPGIVTTANQKRNVHRTWGLFSESIVKTIEQAVASMSWTAKDASITQVYLAVGKRIRDEKITGRYYHPQARETLPHAHAANKTLQRHLWTLSEEVVKAHVDD